MFTRALSVVALLCLCAHLHAQSLPFGLFGVSVSGNTQTLGADCSSALPCQVSIGGNTVSFASASTVTAPSGANDVALAYVDSLNPTMLTVGTNTTTLTCGAGATCKTGITQFPIGSYPLYQWPIVNGAFQPYNVSYDKRALMTSPVPLSPGPGITLAQVNGLTQIAVDASYLSGGGGGTSGVSSFDNRLGAVTLQASDIIAALNLASGTSVATKSGPLTQGHLSVWDANGNLIDGGVVPSGGAGSGTTPITITTTGLTSNQSMFQAVITSPNGYGTYGSESDTGQLYTWGVGGSTSYFENSFYLWNNTLSQPILSVNPANNQATFYSTGVVPVTITSGSTNASSLEITNTSNNASWEIQTAGSRNPGGFGGSAVFFDPVNAKTPFVISDSGVSVYGGVSVNGSAGMNKAVVIGSCTVNYVSGVAVSSTGC